MTLINEVKKALCRTGIEMDADDIADHLWQRPGHRARVSRTQVSHALQALASTEHDIIRTRPGLYQHRPVPPLTSSSPADVVEGRPGLGATPSPRPAPARSFQPCPGSAGVVEIIGDATYVLDRLAALSDQSPEAAIDIERVTAYLLGIAQVAVGPARLTWCAGPTAAAVELTRQQCAQRSVVAIASPIVVDQAVATACALQTVLRVWALEPRGVEMSSWPVSSECIECTELDIPSLLAACRPPAPRVLAVDGAPIKSGCEKSSPTAPFPRQGSRLPGLDALWQLDVDLYRRPIVGVTGQGNAHTLRRQALLVGITYAERWSLVVTDAAREQAISGDGSLWVPGRLYPDLLTFAETHGLPVHGSQVIKNHLKRGFCQHLNGAAHPHASRDAA